MSRPALADILHHPERNGLYRLPAGVAVPTAVPVRGAALTGKSAMLQALAAALAFPDYFGLNWDALEECLTDLSWRPGGIAVVIDDATVPETRAPEDWGVLLDILADAARYWQDEGRAFSVFLQGSHAALPLVAA